jgi:hypothetical protein
MKPGYKLVITDNKNNATIVELDVQSFNYTINRDGMTVEAKGYPFPIKEMTQIVYNIESPKENCLHEWEEYYGLEERSAYCKYCGTKA